MARNSAANWLFGERRQRGRKMGEERQPKRCLNARSAEGEGGGGEMRMPTSAGEASSQ